MTDKRAKYDYFPAFIIGVIEAIVIALAIFCFLHGKGINVSNIFLYTAIAVVFISVLLSLGAFYTRREEMENNNGESKILKIYQSLDIDDSLKKAMTEDTLKENELWNKEWQQGDNATSSLSPFSYAVSVFAGFITGGTVILLNNFLIQLPDFRALLIPFILLAVLGYFKYKLSNRNPVTGMLLIAVGGMVAAFGAYYMGSLF